MTRADWFACTDARVLLDYVRREYGARWGEDSDGICCSPGCCGTPLPTCDEIREEWEAPAEPEVAP